MPDDSGELVFVYGPLRRGGSESFRMEGVEFIAKGNVRGMLFRLPEGPALVIGDLTAPRVAGELYRVNRDHLQMLDELDGLDPEAREKSDRRRSRVHVHDLYKPGDSWEAWTWEWAGCMDPAQWIQSGDWLKEYRPSLADRFRLFHWFTLIGLICVVSCPLWMLAAPFPGYYKTPLARLARDAMILVAALSPFAALFSLWLAKRRGEKDGLFGGIFVLAIIACSIVIFGLVMWLVEIIRR